MEWLLIILIAATPPVSTEDSPRGLTEKDWEVQVEFTAMALPQKHALPLLDDLSNDAKSAEAYRKVRAIVAKGEGRHIGSQIVTTENGVQAEALGGEELRYPIEFEVPTYPNLDSKAQLAAAAKQTDSVSLTATIFETRNLGLSLEVKPEVSKDGRWMRVATIARHVRHLGTIEYSAGITPEGLRIVSPQPRVLSLQNTGTFYLENHVPVLAGVHFPSDQKGTVEVFFLRGWTKRKPAALRK